MKKSFTFYIFLPGNLFANPINIKTNMDLQIGDQLNFFDHHLYKELTEEYKTTVFIITQRQFSVGFNEMALMVQPCIEK